MSSSVCQGLQSCLEVVESRFLRLKLAPPKPNFIEPEPVPYNEEKTTTTSNQNMDKGGWSLLQSLSNVKVPTENDKVYVHPLLKRSACRLSDKSLEMCTERLGSETGSELTDCSDGISLFSLDTQTVACNIPSKEPKESLSTREMDRSNSFPPPLTSISGSNYVRVKPHREGGRLVLQAISFPHCDKYFHAERSEGRLTLSLFKDATPVFEAEEEEDREQEQEQEEEEDGEEVYEEVDVEVEEEEFNEGTENKEGNSGNVGGEIGTGKKFLRRCICKRSGHKGGLLNWKPFLVAT